VSTQDDLVEVFALEESDAVVDVRAVAACRLIMHHADGHTEETEVRGNGPHAPGALFKLGANRRHLSDGAGTRSPTAP
jgi:hypothetical protein